MLLVNWKRVALRAHSMWFGAYLPVLWLLIPELLWVLFDWQMSPLLVWGGALLLATAAGVLRLRDQRLERRA